MLIRTSRYKYYHIRANGAQKLSACTYNFSGRIYMTNTSSYQAVKSSRCTQQEPDGTEQCHRPLASLWAPSGKLTAHNTVTIHILQANYSVLPSLKQVSFLKTSDHPISRYNTPSRTIKIHEKWLGPLDEGSTCDQRSNPASRRHDDNKNMFHAQWEMVLQIASCHNCNSISVFRFLLRRWN